MSGVDYFFAETSRILPCPDAPPRYGNSAHRQWGAYEKSMCGRADWRFACFYSSVFACCAGYSDPSSARRQRLQESILNKTFELRPDRLHNSRVLAE